MTTSRRRLLLSPHCRISADGDALLAATREMEYACRTEAAATFARVLAGLRAPARPMALAASFDLDCAPLEPLLSTLIEDSVLLDLDAAAEADDSILCDAMSREARFWARSIFEQPFWEDLLQGRFTAAEVFGWGVEFYHFVDAANLYMPLGVAHTRSARGLREAICRHYLEEREHGAIFLEGLHRCGIDRESVRIAPPLAQTHALINRLAELAIEGEVTYTAAFAVMQPGISEPSVEALDAFYGRLTERYPFATPMFEAFRRHACLDLDLHHEHTTFALLCRNGLDSAQRARAVEAMRMVAEHFILFFEGIRDAYGEQEELSLRRPLVPGVLR